MLSARQNLISLITIISISLTGCGGHRDVHKEDSHEESEAHHEHEGAFEMDHEQIEKFGIRQEKVEPGEFSSVIAVSGQIEPSASDIYTISAKKNGIFNFSPGLSVGSHVNAGSVIGYISPEGIQGGDLSKASMVNLESARKEYERLKPLYKDGLVTASTFQEAERAYKEAEALSSGNTGNGRMTVVSPAEGTISSFSVNSGQYVETGAPIAIVSKNARLTLRADLPSRYSSFIPEIISANFRPEGTDSVVALSENSGKLMGGSMSGENGYIPVYFSFEGNPQSVAGLHARVFLLGNKRENVMSVPRSALIEMQGNCYVYVSHHGHAFEKRLVKTGSTDGVRVEILEGLEPGEEIVSKGASIVRMAETSAVAPPSHSHNH